jgi:hypothetical protein
MRICNALIVVALSIAVTGCAGMTDTQQRSQGVADGGATETTNASEATGTADTEMDAQRGAQVIRENRRADR